MTGKEFWTWLSREDVWAWMSREDVQARFFQRLAASKSGWLTALFWVASGCSGAALAFHLPPALLTAIGVRTLNVPWVEQMARYDPRLGRPYSLPLLYDLHGNPRRLPEPGH